MSDRMIVVAPGGEGGGQTHLREETTASELSLPARQWRALVRLRYLVVGCCIGIFVAWSPWSFLALGLAAIGLLALRFDWDENIERWRCKWRGGDDAVARLVRGIVIPCLLVIWIIAFDDILALAWPEFLDLGLFLLPLRWVWRLHIAWRLGATVILSVPIWSYKIWAYRLRAEIADPSWSAPIAPRAPDTGPAFPGAEIRSASTGPAPPPSPGPREEIVTLDMWRGRGNERPDRDKIQLLGPSRDARARLQQAAQWYRDGVAFSEPQMAGTGKPLTGPEFRKLRDEFLARKWAKWIDRNAHNRGVWLTVSGEWVMETLAEGDGRLPHST